MARRLSSFTPRSILCAVDFSAQSATALRHAAALTRRSRGRITVLFVNDPLLDTAAAAAAYDTRALARATLRELRSFVQRSLPSSGSPSMRYLVALGKPAREILKTAARLRSDLVVVGTEGLGGASKLFFGSTTEQLLRLANTPVLAVPTSGRPRAKTPARDWPGTCLVAPNDLGNAADADAAQAGAVARAFGADLILVHVIPRVQRPPWSRADLDAHYRTAIATAQAGLDALRSTVGDDVATECRVVVGHPADEIAALATARRTGLVVLTLRGRGGLLGSRPGAIAYHVLMHRVSPVLALPPRRRARSRARAV
jgi:nucleotide-binding universal stress UspA family protein